MDNNTPSRDELKGFFVKNALPTESNFADLIDGGLNQQDDGIRRLPDGPLCIEAGDSGDSEQESLHLYSDFTASDPAWRLNLNPRVDPADPVTAKAGFNLADGDGKSRLFVRRSDGRVGVGTLEPRSALHIATPSSILTLGNSEEKHLTLDNDEIQARNNGATSALRLQAAGGPLILGSVGDDNLFVDGTKIRARNGGTPSKLHLQDQSGGVVVGPESGESLTLENQGIQARRKESTSTLHLQDQGGDIHFHGSTSADHFRFLKDAGHFFGAVRNYTGNRQPGLLRMAVGRTQPGQDWQTYESGIAIEIDTTVADFESTPFYFPTLHGDGHHWKPTGVTSIYNPTANSFRIQLKGASSLSLTSLSLARDHKWYIVWLAVGV